MLSDHKPKTRRSMSKKVKPPVPLFDETAEKTMKSDSEYGYSGDQGLDPYYGFYSPMMYSSYYGGGVGYYPSATMYAQACPPTSHGYCCEQAYAQSTSMPNYREYSPALPTFEAIQASSPEVNMSSPSSSPDYNNSDYGNVQGYYQPAIWAIPLQAASDSQPIPAIVLSTVQPMYGD
eukprot:TRINITY_DN870_c0_g1_i1.p1 TRINITY_DN870_c0_g1~~TRINITY_DN870_c0_g1_i1.p1  ORF type:complete len:177 (-),score=25.83 TRINITY_DN870_c0_g1_i1:134-664(-)